MILVQMMYLKVQNLAGGSFDKETAVVLNCGDGGTLVHSGRQQGHMGRAGGS